VRVRFDSGWDVDSPDRAEFFYAKCGCYRDLAGTDLYDPDAPGPGPGVLQGLNYSQFSVLGEIGVRDRLSFFAELPLRSIRPTAFAPGTGSFDSAFGLGDISAGVKWSFFSDASTDVTMMLRGSFPSGNAGKGLGTHHGSLEPAFLVRRDLGDRAGLEGELGFSTPLSSSKGPHPATDGQFASSVMYYGFGPSFDLVKTDRGTLSPVIELVAWHVFLGYQTSTLAINGGQANATDIANLKLGARYTMKGKDSIYVGVGFALTDSDWYGKILRLEYRRGF
jgi:hypothetical protein